MKSSLTSDTHPGLERFSNAFHPDTVLLLGPDGLPIEQFLSIPPEDWING